MSMAAGVDMNEVYELSGYLKSMESRLKNLGVISDSLEVDVEKLNTDINVKKNSMKKELDEMKNEVSNIKDNVRELQKTILLMINQFKSSVKADEMERFKKRMDLWAPESLVTRREAEKVNRETTSE